jgi:hypothetical protein
MMNLDEEQTNRLAPLVTTYVAETVSVQQRVAAALPAAEVDKVLFPRRSWGRNGRSRSRGSGNGDDDDAAEPAPEPSDSEKISARLREIDARLHLAEPRRRFERALSSLLTPEQRERAFRNGARLLTFRERSATPNAE